MNEGLIAIDAPLRRGGEHSLFLLFILSNFIDCSHYSSIFAFTSL